MRSTLQMEEKGLLGILAEIPTLKHLHIGDVQLSAQAMRTFWRESKGELEELILECMKLSTDMLSVFRSFQSLSALGMTSCKQVRASPAFFWKQAQRR